MYYTSLFELVYIIKSTCTLDNTVNVKKIRGGNIFAIFADTIIPRKYSPRNVHHYYTRQLAFGGRSQWRFTIIYYQSVRGDNLPDPKGPLSATIPRQAIAEENKQVQEGANRPRNRVLAHLCRAIVSAATANGPLRRVLVSAQQSSTRQSHCIAYCVVCCAAILPLKPL